MQPESKTSAELIERYEKSFGAASRKRGMIVIGTALLLLIIVIVGFTSSMSYIGGLNAHVYEAFDAKEKTTEAAP